MGFRSRVKNKRKGLQSQHEYQNKNKDTKGVYPTVILKDKLPAGVETWWCKEDRHIIDILPWEAGDDMPLGDRGVPVKKEGELAYVLDLKIHTNVGPMKVPYVCPYENFGRPCPMCEYIKSHELSTDAWKLVNTKRRVFYLIWVHDTRETQRKGVMLWEISHYAMEEKLAEISTLPRGGGAIVFSDHEKGQSVSFRRKGSGMKNTSYLGHSFTPREMTIPDKILDQGFPIDQYINMHPSYEEIEKTFKEQLKTLDTGESSDEAGSNYNDDEKPPMWQDDYDDDDKPTSKKSRFKSKKKKSRFKK